MPRIQRLRSREADAKRFHHLIPRTLRRKIKKSFLDIKYASDRKNALPDFFIIGTMKSGTTTLYMALEEHPDIFPAKTKEVHFFNTHRDLGERFFRSHFPPPDALEKRGNEWGRQIVGEATPDYVFHPSAAALCRALTPDARIIMLMRNPVERAFSHWKQGRRFGFEDATFEEAIMLEEERLAGETEKLLRDPHYYSYRHQHYSYLTRGRYAEQIRTWLNYFPMNQFLFINSSDFFKDGMAIYRRTTKFLGVSDWVPEEIDTKFPGMTGELSTETAEKLSAYFAPYNEDLYELIGERYAW